MLPSFSMAWRHHLRWRRQRSSSATSLLGPSFRFLWCQQKNDLKYSTSSPHASDWGSLQKVQRQKTHWQKNGHPHLQETYSWPRAPKMEHSSTVQWQGKSHCAIPCTAVLVSNIGTPSMVIDGREGYQTKGTAQFRDNNWWCSLFSHQHISQLSVLGYLATFLTEADAFSQFYIRRKNRNMDYLFINNIEKPKIQLFL